MYRARKISWVFAVLLAMFIGIAGCGEEDMDVEEKIDAALPEVRWTMQTPWDQGWLLYEMAENFAERVREMSSGKFVIQVHPAGEVVGATDVLDATGEGVIEAYHSWPGYWMGKHPSAPFFSSIPLHLDPLMHVTWMYGYGGKELYQEMMNEIGQNVIVMPGGVTGPEMLAHSNKPIERMSDWRGLKYRAPGHWGEILKEQGVSVAKNPGVELYPALDRGILDAVEFSTPAVNRQTGFHRVTDYIVGPGLHQPTSFFEVGFNKDAYYALPKIYRAILENAAMAMTLDMWTRSNVADMDALDFFKEQGVRRTYVDPDVQRELREHAWSFIDNDVREKNNDHYTRTWNSVKEFWDRFSDYEEFMVPVRE